MAFDTTLYNNLLFYAKDKIFQDGKRGIEFNEYDIVHDLFIHDELYDLSSAKKKIICLIKKEKCSRTNYFFQQKKYDSFYSCNKCHESKPAGAFRIRYELREIYWEYINDTCIECEREIKRKYDAINNWRAEYKHKAKDRAKKYHWENRSKIIIQQKQNRETEEYKQRRREYNILNRGKIRELAKAARLRRNQKNKLLKAA